MAPSCHQFSPFSEGKKGLSCVLTFPPFQILCPYASQKEQKEAIILNLWSFVFSEGHNGTVEQA